MAKPRFFRFDKERSSVIRELLYDPRCELLYVGFRRVGAVYCYKGVGLELFESLIAAESMGRYFTRHIKREFDTAPVDRDEWANLLEWANGKSKEVVAAEYRKNNDAWLKKLSESPLAIRF